MKLNSGMSDNIEVFVACFMLSMTICLTILSLYQYVKIRFDNYVSYCRLTLKPYKYIFLAMCF